MNRAKYVVWQRVAALLALSLSLSVFGRGEPWVTPPPVPPAIETLTNEARYVEWKFRTNVTDRTTGLDVAGLTRESQELLVRLGDSEPWCVVKARLFALVCDRMAFDVSPLDWYPSFAIWNRYDRPLAAIVNRHNNKIAQRYHPEASRLAAEGNGNGRWFLWKDFDHSVPEWSKSIALGFPGLVKRAADQGKVAPYYRALDITGKAVLRLLERMAEHGRRKLACAEDLEPARRERLKKQVFALEQLAKGPPRTAYETMTFIYLYFFLSEHVDFVQCRSLSVIDVTLWPFYREDVAAGRTTEAEFREQFRHFLWQWGSIDNYWGQPVTMGGTRADGTTEYNPLSSVILDVMDECYLPTPKFHLKVGPSMPKHLLDKALDMARRHRPLSFCNEQAMIDLLVGHGCPEEAARQCITKGCYEYCPPDGANGTDMGELSYVKPLETMLAEFANGVRTPADFEAFERAYHERLASEFEVLLNVIEAYESHLDDVNPANMSSLGVENSVLTGRDAFATGAKNGNNTGIETGGFGTAVDVLMAVKEIVYEKKLMTLGELGKLMAKNWEGQEDLRLRMVRSVRKWGNGDAETDAVARRLSKVAAHAVNDRPNARGGRYLLSGHSARAFVILGSFTGATPDGRKAGEEFAKNLSATMGADTEGVTALVNSLGRLDSMDFPYDFPLDVMFHSSTVAGDRGLEVMRSVLDVYFANRGVMMQFNVFSP